MTVPMDRTQTEASTASRQDPEMRERLAGVVTRYGLLITWILMVALFALAIPQSFVSLPNAAYILNSQATLLIVTIGVTVALAAGEYDLSSSGTVTITLVLLGYLSVVRDWAILPAVLAALAVAVLVGCVNAFLIVVVGVNSLIVTLASGSVMLGASLGINNLTVSDLSPTLVNLSRSTLLDVQLAVFYALGLALVAWYVFQHTVLGRKLFFTGAGRDVARLSGVRIDRIRTGALLVSSVCAGVAGVLLGGVLGSADPNAGTNYALAPFAAAMLGATSFTPGRYNVLGSTVATYFLATGITGLQLSGQAGWVSQVFYGMALILGVGLSTYAGRMNTATTRSSRRPGTARRDV